MALKPSLDADIVATRIAEQASASAMPGSPIWDELKVKSFGPWGSKLTRAENDYYNSGAQTDKGSISDIRGDAACTVPCTPNGYQKYMQGFVRAALRTKQEREVLAVDGTANQYDTDVGHNYQAGDLILAKGLDDAANNGLKQVSAIAGGAEILVTDTGLVDAADQDPDPRGVISKVGHHFALETFEVEAVVNGDDTLQITGHPFETGWGPVRMTNAGGGLPAGLAVATDYWVIDFGANLVKLATTKALALAGTPINLTTDGTGTHTVSSPGVIVDDDNTWPRLCFLSFDAADLGVISGELLGLGGDTTQFVPAGNNGFVVARRVVDAAGSVAAGGLGAGGFIELLWHSVGAMADSTNGTQTPRIFCGRVLKNEKGSLVLKKWHRLERELGAPDDSDEEATQFQYLDGCVPDGVSWNLSTAENVTMDLSWKAISTHLNTSVDGEDAGDRPDPPDSDEDVFNATADVAAFHIGVYTEGNEHPDPLFAHVDSLKVTIDPTATILGAIGDLGGFDASRGKFMVGGSFTGYFVDIAALQSVYADDNGQMFKVLAKNNRGIGMALPKLELNDDPLNVATGGAIMLNMSFRAHRGRSVYSEMDHSMLLVYFDYLPDSLMPVSQV